MTPDKYQAAFIAAVTSSDSNLLADAKAGCGKSTTIEESIRQLAGRTWCTVFAFNKAIATAMQERFDAGNVERARAQTFNAAGHRTLMQNMKGKLTLEKFKSGRIMQDLGIRFENRFDAQTVERLVSIAKANAHVPGQVPWDSLSQHMGFAIGDPDLEAKIIAAAEAVFAQSYDWAMQKFIIDFDDQLYIPIMQRMPLPKSAYVFVDESQDVSPIQVEMIARMASERIICVGDERQAIYGFRGADAGAINSLTERFRLQALPLNICYRCSVAVIENVQRLVPELEAAPGAKAGSVGRMRELPPLKSFEHDAMILCRMNGPLFGLACEFLRARVPFQFKGDGLAEVMNSYIGRILKASEVAKRADPSIDSFLSMAKQWFKVEIGRYEKRGAWGMVDALQDFHSVFKVLGRLEFVQKLSDLEDALSKIFAGQSGPTLSSVHKAKGLEARVVYIFRPDLMPSKRAQPGWQMQQEMNLIYVAETRAMERLVYLDTQGGGDEDE